MFNNYGNGTDTLGNPDRSRIHTDDSIEIKYYNHPESTGITRWLSPSRAIWAANTAAG